MTTVPFTPPSPHAALLLLCARVQLDEPQRQQLRTLLAKTRLNWDHLLALAARHGLLPLLAPHLRACAADGVPYDVLAQLKKYQHVLAVRNLGLVGALVHLLRLFDAHHIPALPFKGPTLALFAYGSLGLREFGDLDLLLRPGDLARARALLREQGYEAQYSLTAAQETAYLRSLGQLPLENADRVVVELHDALTPRAFPFPLAFAQLWRRRCLVPLTGQPLTAPGAEDLLLILCMHGAKHLWKNLGWICDVAELLRRQSSLDWEQVGREARRLRSERLLWLGVQLAERVLEAPLPPDVSRAARRDTAVRALAKRVLRHLLDDREWTPGGLESLTFHLLARERLRDGLRFGVSLFLTPTLADWQALSLPPALSFLYYGVRPQRLLGKYFRPL